MDFDTYLGTANALRQTESAQGAILHPGQLLDDMRVVAFLDPGVTFITSGRFKPDGCNFKDSVPPPDANWDNHIGYPTYVVEPGAKLIFTENDAYPSALIRRP